VSQLALKDIEDYYDRRWQRDFDVTDPMREARRQIVRRYLQRLGSVGRILDVGCGKGLEAPLLGQFGELWGIDLSKQGVEEAKRSYPAGTFVAGDLYTAGLPSGTFDVVTAIEVIEHVPDQRACLQRCCEMLRPGGYLVLTVPNRYVMERCYGRARLFSDELLSMPEMRRRGYLQPIENWLNRAELGRLLTELFNILDITSVGFGAGHRDWLRLANSHKLCRAVGKLGLALPWNRLRGKLGWGLHLAALAQARISE
jgi:2-polyprenyl-3-methyl-5-hydroxy-6-metoxy-1,4-benzoquinol methylase